MKRIISVFLAVILLTSCFLSMWSCNNKDKDDGNQNVGENNNFQDNSTNNSINNTNNNTDIMGSGACEYLDT